jgi:type IV secretion system protein VirB3
MLPFIIVSGILLLGALWGVILVGLWLPLLLIAIYIPLIVTMQQITRRDDQRLKQVIMRARMRLVHAKEREQWGAVSYSPLAYKKRKKVT